eukprot:TRINITY_DN82_c0_g1_i5.p1 TRINITY_DN82_c0_g1~~TRINITY_DN82_c0_g1_i5.p1  ORF type:complete len:460 (+),score=120.58 TRINITY_DN82_c0_g1_i5:194-1381(+)
MMNSEVASHEITKEAVALMRRAASITGNEEIKFAASHIQSEYDKKQHSFHQNPIAKELPPKVEEFQKEDGRKSMEQRKRFSSMRGVGVRQNRPANPAPPQSGGGFQPRSLQKNRASSFGSLQSKANDQQQQQQQLHQLPPRLPRQNRFPKNTKVDAQGNQLNKELEDDASSSSGTLSDVSSNGLSENRAEILMVHIPSASIAQNQQQKTRPPVHPLQRTKSASTSDLRGRNQRKPIINANNRQQQIEEESSFAKLSLEEAHILQSIADKTGNRQLKALSSRVQKVVNEQHATQTANVAAKEAKETIETKEVNQTKETTQEIGKKSKSESKTEESVGYLSLIDLIPTEIPQSSICELCECNNNKASESNFTSDKTEAKLPPPAQTQEPLSSGASAC